MCSPTLAWTIQRKKSSRPSWCAKSATSSNAAGLPKTRLRPCWVSSNPTYLLFQPGAFTNSRWSASCVVSVVWTRTWPLWCGQRGSEAHCRHVGHALRPDFAEVAPLVIRGELGFTSPACGGGRRARRARRVGELSPRAPAFAEAPPPRPSPASGRGAHRRRRRLLPQRLGDLHQFGMDEFIAADQMAGLEQVVVALEAADGAAGFADDDLSGRQVPGLKVALPIAVEAAGGDERHVERGRAEPAQAGHLVLDFRHLQP